MYHSVIIWFHFQAHGRTKKQPVTCAASRSISCRQLAPLSCFHGHCGTFVHCQFFHTSTGEMLRILLINMCVVNVKLCMMVQFIKLNLPTLLSVTLTMLQGHSNVEQVYGILLFCCCHCVSFSIKLETLNDWWLHQLYIMNDDCTTILNFHVYSI